MIDPGFEDDLAELGELADTILAADPPRDKREEWATRPLPKPVTS